MNTWAPGLKGNRLFEHLYPGSPANLPINIKVSEPGADPYKDVVALIDTGARKCFIPPNLVENLGMTAVDMDVRVELGDQQEVPAQGVVDCVVFVEGVGPKWVQAVVFPVRLFILGMNWLNQVHFHYTREPPGRVLRIESL